MEKEVKDFFREEWVEEPGITMLSEDLVAVLVHLDLEELLAAVEGTLGEAVEIINLTPVGVGEALITPEQISKTNVVLKPLAMVM